MKSSWLEMTIERHKTALSRNNYSRPVQHLLKSSLLEKNLSFFDYGCGKGDDVSALQSLGFESSGWDPHFFLKSDQPEADIVNLGFVLNVIEDGDERIETLQKAWRLTKKALIVSVLSIWDRPDNDLKPFRDGYVTSKKTFQKYYEPGELKAYVDEVLGIDSLPVDPVMVIAFRDNDDFQDYLDRSECRSAHARRISVPLHPIRKTRLSRAIEEFRNKETDLWESLSENVIRYAIPPTLGELQVCEILKSHGVKPIDFLEVIREMVGKNEWNSVVNRTKNYYLARLALSMFRGKPKSAHYTDNDKRSIRAHFNSFANAIEEAKKSLFAVGNPEIVAERCGNCPVGLEDDQALFLHRSLIPQVDSVLQAYIGIGRLFYGELDDVDVFKIHKASSKLTLLIYKDFEESDRPILQTRVKISFRTRKILFFDHQSEQQELLNKSELM